MLVSKLQYFFYEVGEFSSIKHRSIEQTIAFIHEFPWEEQRKSSFVSLNGASVTIEDKTGSFLKIGLYYHGKFVLYLLNDRKKLFQKVVDTLAEVLVIASDFFSGTVLEHGFVKYREWVWNPSRYFETRIFEYKVSLKRIFWFLLFPVGFACLFLFALFLGAESIRIDILLVLIPVFILISGVKIWLFFNYYRYSRKVYLNVSKGINEFSFGLQGTVRQYNKQDIEWIKEYANQKGKIPWSDSYVYVIRMKDGRILKLTNLVISSFAFAGKFPEHNVNTVHKFIATVNTCQ